MDVTSTLFFPVTPFAPSGEVDTDALDTFVTARMSPDVSAVFAGCGTGEFYALGAGEVAEVCRVAVAAAGGTPVVAGIGGPLGHARACAAGATAAGAAALLVMPPYLVNGDAEGFTRYVDVLAADAAVPLIVYHRPGAMLDVAAVQELFDMPAVIGVKDGAGDIDLLRAVVERREAAGRPDFLVFNGMPFAELYDAEYRRAGITNYSSSTYTMAPAIALAFRRAAESGDRDCCQLLLDEFYRPLDRLRSRREGYNITLVKAGVELDGYIVGPVRPPLVPPLAEDVEELRRLLDHGRAVAGA